jgi:hypothetical protein
MEHENAASEIIHSEEIKSFICCVHWEKFQIDGFEILGKQADSFLQLFDAHLINNEDYIVPCGFLSQEEQGIRFNLNHFSFIDVVSYFEDGLAYYTTISLNVEELLNLNYTLGFEALTFDKQNKPTRQVLLNFWNIDPIKVDKHYLKLSNGISDDALILHFDEDGFLSTMEYWSPC